MGSRWCGVAAGTGATVLPSPVTRILLVRHGQSVWNADGRWQGQADPPLSDLGVDQAAAAADSDAVDGVRALYSSDLERARHTAQLLGVRLGLDPVVDERLRERHAGAWEGCTRAEIDAGWPGFLDVRPTSGGLRGRRLGARPRARRRWPRSRPPTTATCSWSPTGEWSAPSSATSAVTADGLIPNLGGRWLLHDGTAPVLGDRIVLLDPDQVDDPRADLTSSDVR